MSDLDLPKGVTMHRGKLRIAFRPPNERVQRKRSLGIIATKANIKAAEQMLNAIRRDISLGQFDLADYFPNDPSLKKEERMLSHMLKKHFIEAKTGRVKGSSLDAYKRHADLIIKALGDIDIANLDAKGAKAVRQTIIETSPSDYTAGLRLWIVRISVRRAVRELDLKFDPFGSFLDNVERKSKAVKIAEQSTDVLNASEVFTIYEAEKIVKVCRSGNNKRLVTFLFWSGLRPGEAAALRREDICLPYITVRHTLTQRGEVQTPKTGRERKIYLPSSARSALELQLLTHDFERVWTTSMGQPYKTATLFSSKFWRKILERAGLVYRRPYMTRHSFASWMLKAGEPESAVANHLGHNDVTMVRKVYGKFIPDSKPVWTLDDPAKIDILKRSMITTT